MKRNETEKLMLGLLVGVLAAAVIAGYLYLQTTAYFNSKVLGPTISSYFLQTESFKTYNDEEGSIRQIKVETLDNQISETEREVTVTVRIIPIISLAYMSEEEADRKKSEWVEGIKKINLLEQDYSGFRGAVKKSAKKVKVKDVLIIYYKEPTGDWELLYQE